MSTFRHATANCAELGGLEKEVTWPRNSCLVSEIANKLTLLPDWQSNICAAEGRMV